jgi:hypothetical protein
MFLQIDITSLYDFDILFWNCFDSVVYVYFGFPIDKKKEFEEGLIRIRQSKNDQKKKDQKTNNDQQNTMQKTKIRAPQTPLKTMGELWCSGMVSSFCSTGGTCSVTLVTMLYW